MSLGGGWSWVKASSHYHLLPPPSASSIPHYNPHQQRPPDTILFSCCWNRFSFVKLWRTASRQLPTLTTILQNPGGCECDSRGNDCLPRERRHGDTPHRRRRHRRRQGHQYRINLSEYYTAAPGGGGAAKEGGEEGGEAAGLLLGTNAGTRVRLRRRETLQLGKSFGSGLNHLRPKAHVFDARCVSRCISSARAPSIPQTFLTAIQSCDIHYPNDPLEALECTMKCTCLPSNAV